MGNRRFDPRRIKLHYSHTIEEIANALGCDRQTVRLWIKQGMVADSRKRPTLVRGVDARAFLERKYSNGKQSMLPGEMRCFKCRTPRMPAFGEADLLITAPNRGSLQGMCPVCATIMYRHVARASWRASAGNLIVTLKVGQVTLDDSSDAALKLHFKQWMQGQ